MKLTAKKGFTLIEMLIVIVIIGVLAAALIPRLGTARGKANDTARKADLQQLATALIAYQMDQNEYPSTAVHFGDTTTAQNGTNAIGTLLVRGGLVNIPKDPAGTLISGGITPANATGAKGQYLYTPVIKNGITSGGFVLMAAAETEGGANFVFCGAGNTPIISGTAQIMEGTGGIKLCKSIKKAAGCTGRTLTSSTDVDCTYNNTNQLRYIYVY